MTLHPISVVDQVLDEYRSYLFTEFRARDEKLRKSLEEALDEPGFLAQDPFFQAHRPFKAGRRWRNLGIDEALAKAMEKRSGSPEAWLHQSDSIAHLLSPAATPLVVTTGTGSGKTECFLLPVIQNAIEDSTRSKRGGLTAILIYPMNALANDQEDRIHRLLEDSGHPHVSVARYDRSTKEDERERLRRKPPHILLTNYMMLEYLLVRPADREALFANHRTRFVVLDEVHTYRGSLGANIALLFRRLMVHLRHARRDGEAGSGGDRTGPSRPVPVATSATIKTMDEPGKSHDELIRLRDNAVQEFLAKLTGCDATAVKIVGESLRDIEIPAEARWSGRPAAVQVPDHRDPEAVRRALVSLSGANEDLGLEAAACRAAILWKLNELLVRKPCSVPRIVERILAEVQERRGAEPAAVRREVEAARVAGAALPDSVPGALRLRTHRFIRGGWKFHRCVDPTCGRLFPRGEEQCGCGKAAAPLYLCRSCGTDTLRFSCVDPLSEPLVAGAERSNENEWMLYRRGTEGDAEEEDLVDAEKQMKERPVLRGSFDPATCLLSRTTRVHIECASSWHRDGTAA